MNPHPHLEHGLAILNARLQQPALPRSPVPRVDVRPFITVSRESGAGATTIGQQLVTLLDQEPEAEGHPWVLLDKDLLTHALTTQQLPDHLERFLPEDRISEIEAVIGEMVGLHPSLWQLEQKISEAIFQLAHVGHVILVGRAAHLYTRNVPGGLHVRLVAPQAVRVQRVAATLHCSPEAAAAQIEKNDLARRRYVHANFGEDIDDAHLYDLVCNTGSLSPASVARLIVTALRDPRTAHPNRETAGAPNGP